MPITDLSGTKWLLNETLTFPNTQAYSINLNYNSIIFSSINFVRNPAPPPINYADILMFDDISVYNFTTNSWPSDARTIEITGGTDATNATLIAWLEQNATQIIEPTITDLTGYTWVGNNSIDFSQTSSHTTYNINFSFVYNNNVLNYDSISFDTSYHEDMLTSESWWEFIIGYFNSQDSSFNLPTAYLHQIGAFDSNRWTVSEAKTITITGGTDATNATLIAWLEANGTLTAPQPTGYTINIDGVEYSVGDGDSLLVNSTGLYNSTTSTQVYTFTPTTGRFGGFNTSSGQTTPSSNYEIGDTFTASQDLTLYSVEQLPRVIYDLDNLNLDVGTHTITAKAKGSGFADSVASNSISFTVAPSGYNLTISGVYESWSTGNLGSKLTIDNTTCSVDYLGNTTNIPHTFTNVTTFEILPNGDTYMPNICNCKIISGSGTFRCGDYPNGKPYEAGYQWPISDAGMRKIEITMTSDTVIQLGYYSDEE